LRIGLLAKKIGMSALYDESGQIVPVTLLEIGENIVSAVRTMEKNGYTAVQISTGEIKESRVNKPQRVEFNKLNLALKRHSSEFRVSGDNLLSVGDIIETSHFVTGQYVDVTAVSIGKGFAGGMKRHNFVGLGASHGESLSHRSIGSTGCRQDPGKVSKGKKMPGHMGAVQKTIQNLQVIQIDSELNIIAVKGAVPGHDGTLVKIKDAYKRAVPKAAPFPAAIKKKINQTSSNESVETKADTDETTVSEN
jgi:large subunit ribosomal protein L3